MTVANIFDIRTVEPGNGADDLIHGDAGRDRIFGGNGVNADGDGFDGDRIFGDADEDLIFGDHGHLGYRADDAELATLDVIESIDTAFGGIDTITDDAADDIILGGFGGDTINAGTGANIVFGDHGRILGIDGTQLGTDFNHPVPLAAADRHPLTLALVASLVPGSANQDGGADTITTGAGRDMIFGGAAGDTIVANSGETAAGPEGNNIVFGDYGLVDYLSEELAHSSTPAKTLQQYIAAGGGAGTVGAAADPVRPADIDRIWSLATALGGNDQITTGNRNDIVLGGAGGDTIVAGNGNNLVLGDSGRLTADERDPKPSELPLVFAVHEFLICKIETTSDGDFSDGGADTITGSDFNDILFGGAGNDTIYAGAGDDLVFGDQGRVECKNDVPLIPEISLRPICWDEFPTGYLLFEAIKVDNTTGIGDDTVYGQDGSDVVLGQEGRDILYGGNGDDGLIGGSNVAGALDSDDRLDGGGGHDAIAGDNAEICFRPDAIDPRFRVLAGTQIYYVPTVGVAAPAGSTANQLALIDSYATATGQADPRYAGRTTNGVLDKNSGHAEYHIELLDHADDIAGGRPARSGATTTSPAARARTRSSASSATM